MKRTVLSLFLLFGLVVCSFAQSSLFDASEATPGSIKQLSKGASTDIDAIIFNPAGTSFVSSSFELSIGFSSSQQSVSNFPYINGDDNLPIYDRGHYSFVNHNAPSLLTLIRFNNFTFSFSYAHEGGMGKWSDVYGTSAIDDFLHQEFSDAYAIQEISDAFDNIKVQEDDHISLYSQDYLSRYYNRSLRLGFSYRFNNHFSAYSGIKVNLLSHIATYDIGLYVKREHTKDRWRMSDYLYVVADRNSLFGQLDNSSDFSIIDSFLDGVVDNSNNNYTTASISPVIGIDINYPKINLGAKFEYGTKTSKQYGRIPSLLSIGLRYEVLQWLRIHAGCSSYYNSSSFISTANGANSITQISLGLDFRLKNTFDFSISGLYQRGNYTASNGGKIIEFPFASYKISGGFGVRLSPRFKANLGLLFEPTSINLNVNSTTNGVNGSCIYQYDNRYIGALGLVYTL